MTTNLQVMKQGLDRIGKVPALALDARHEILARRLEFDITASKERRHITLDQDLLGYVDH